MGKQYLAYPFTFIQRYSCADNCAYVPTCILGHKSGKLSRSQSEHVPVPDISNSTCTRPLLKLHKSKSRIRQGSVSAGIQICAAATKGYAFNACPGIWFVILESLSAKLVQFFFPTGTLECKWGRGRNSTVFVLNNSAMKLSGWHDICACSL